MNKMSLIEKAIRIAAVAHKGQTRKDGDIPYVVHPFMVSVRLLQHGFRDEVIAAALTHDVLEDTDFSEEHLLKELGEEVLAIVKTVSENKSLMWEERKKEYIEQVRNPEYPRGMTMGELITNTESFVCLFCGRTPQDFNSWTDDDHDGFCSVPFMRAALMKISVLEHEKWQINRNLDVKDEEYDALIEVAKAGNSLEISGRNRGYGKLPLMDLWMNLRNKLDVLPKQLLRTGEKDVR